MEILLLNISNNITDFKTVASGETIYLKKVFEKIGHDVTIASNKNGKYTKSFEEIEDVNFYDKIVVVSGAINFFGGQESPTIMKNYKMLAQWIGDPIIILQTDARLPFHQVWSSIEKRGWGYKREEVWIESPIKVICQSTNIEEVESQYNKKKEIEFYDIEFEHFPIDQYAALNAYSYVTEPKESLEKEHDLVYYGSFRGGNRAEKMKEYLTGDIADEFDVHVFGTLKEKQLSKLTDKTLPSFGKKIPMNQTMDEVSKSKATIILGEKFYNDAMYTVRVWETMASSAVVLIDEEFDPRHTLFPYSPERYVNDKKELEDILKIITEDENVRNDLLKEQNFAIKEKFDYSQYIYGMNEIL